MTTIPSNCDVAHASQALFMIIICRRTDAYFATEERRNGSHSGAAPAVRHDQFTVVRPFEGGVRERTLCQLFSANGGTMLKPVATG
jgi:hypothetical protein